MDNIDLLLLQLLCGCVLLLVLAVIVKYTIDYFADIKYVKMEMHRADSWNEYVYWRRELRALRWCIIPGMTVDRVKAIKKFFYRGKYTKKHENSDGFFSLLIPSVLGMCLCCVCLAGGTFAWFTASESTGTQNIQTANYSVSVTVIGGDWRSTKNTEVDFTKKLPVGEYEVKITAIGSATNGYCILSFDGVPWRHTSPIAVGETLVFKLDMKKEAVLEVSAQWGSSSKAPEDKIINRAEPYTYGDDSVPPTVSGIEVKNESELKAALDRGETTISIGADFSLTQNHNITLGNVVIFGNNHSFTLGGNIYKGTLFTVEKGASLSIADVTFDYDEDSFEVYYNPSNPWSPKFTTATTATPVEAPAIVSNGNIVLNNVTVKDRYCNVDGSAAVQILYGTAELTDCKFIHNLGKSGSAAVYVGGPKLEGQTTHSVEKIVFNNCDFDGNIQTFENGNAVYIYSAQEARFNGCKFIGNAGMTSKNSEGGGAIYIAKESEEGVTIPLDYKLMNVHIDGCIFKDNISMNDGSAIENQGANLYISNSTFEDNAAKSVGTVSCISYTVAQGASPARIYDCHIDDCTFTDNFATAGAVFGNHASAYDFKITNSIVSKNQGNEAFLLYEGNNLIANCQFTDNSFSKATVNLTYGDDCDGNAIVKDCVFSGSTKPAIRLQAGKRGSNTLNERCTIQGTVTGNIVIEAPNGGVGTSNLIVEGTLNGNITGYDGLPSDSITISGNVIGSVNGISSTQYVVQSGDTLSKIAGLYGESVNRLQVYNNIENSSQIYPGQVIKIPPADWKIPETTTEGTTPPVTEPESTETKPSETETSETGSETIGGTTETQVPQETTGTEPNPSESDGNE